MKQTTVSERGLVLAPLGRDAALACGMLSEAGIEAVACPDLPALVAELDIGAAFAAVTEEAIATADLRDLSAWIEDQEEWSDLPFILLTSGGGGLERNPTATRHLELLGNVTFLERPFHPTTLISLSRSALRARRRQYEARTRLLALRESEGRFRNMADHAPVMMWVTDPTGYCTYLNRAWYEFTGQSEAEAQGYGWLEATHPADKAAAERAFLEANAAVAPFRIEYRLRRADGTYRWAIDAASPRFSEAGDYLGYVGSVIDIDERREIEERQRVSEARLRTLTNALPAFVWFATPDGELHYFNDRWYEYTGQTPEEAMHSGWAATLHPEDADRIAAMWADARARGVTYEVEVRYRRRDGAYRWYVARAEPLRDEHDAITAWFGTSNDIHDRKLAEAALYELNESLEQRVSERTAELAHSEGRFQGIFDSSLQFMALLKPDGTVHEINRTALSWSQIEPHEIVNRPFWLGAPMRGNPQLQAAIKAGIRRAAAGETVRQEHEMRGAGEVRAIIDFSLKPVLHEHGEVVWLVAEGRDISELKAAQEALRQSQKLESMGQLTGGFAHDINNLLTPMTGALDMLQRRGLGGTRERRLIEGALQSAERAKLLVQRLLAFARRQPLQPTAVDIGRVVEGMAALVASTTGPQIRLAVDMAPELPPALADANQLEMAILNLAVNARDAMPTGGSLQISAKLDEVGEGNRYGLSPGRYVLLAVTDTGTGMDAETLKRAVEPFFSTKGVGKGTGLGLSMVHGLAAQLGGSLTIASTPAVGTTVELRLAVAESAPPAVAPVQVGVGWVMGTGTALVVDDEELVCAATADMLGDLGYEIVAANSAMEALQLVEGGLVPCLLVTDHLMPGMSGTDLAREVRRRLPSVRALIISGYADIESIAPDLPRLGKPFRRADLAERLAGLDGAAKSVPSRS